MKKILWTIMIILLINIVKADIFIEPTNVEMTNALPQTYEKTIKITTNAVNDLMMKTEISKELEGIVSIEPEKRILNSKLPIKLNLEIKAQKTEGDVLICFSTEANKISMESSSCMKIPIKINMGTGTNTQITVNDLKIYDSDETLDIEIDYENKGNSDVLITIQTEGITKKIIAQAYIKEKKHIDIVHRFEAGTHEKEFTVLMEGHEIYKSTENFNIGNYEKKAELNLLVPNDAMSNETIPIYVIIKNQGVGIIITTIIEIEKEGETIETHQQQEFVGAGETKEILFKKKLEKGDYKVKAKIQYSETTIDSKETELYVIDYSDSIALSAGFTGLILFILVIFIYLKKKK